MHNICHSCSGLCEFLLYLTVSHTRFPLFFEHKWLFFFFPCLRPCITAPNSCLNWASYCYQCKLCISPAKHLLVSFFFKCSLIVWTDQTYPRVFTTQIAPCFQTFQRCSQTKQKQNKIAQHLHASFTKTTINQWVLHTKCSTFLGWFVFLSTEHLMSEWQFCIHWIITFLK